MAERKWKYFFLLDALGTTRQISLSRSQYVHGLPRRATSHRTLRRLHWIHATRALLLTVFSSALGTCENRMSSMVQRTILVYAMLWKERPNKECVRREPLFVMGCIEPKRPVSMVPGRSSVVNETCGETADLDNSKAHNLTRQPEQLLESGAAGSAFTVLCAAPNHSRRLGQP